MIDYTLEFLRGELESFLLTHIPMGETERVKVSNIVTQDGEDDNTPTQLSRNRILCSVVHMQEERIGREPGKSIVSEDGKVKYREPDLRLNLYLLFAAHFEHYQTGMRNLSGVISFFQSHRVFDPRNYPHMNSALNRLIVDTHTFSMDQAFQFWQSLGGKFLPSMLYKVRLLTFQESILQSLAEPILDTDTNLQRQ